MTQPNYTIVPIEEPYDDYERLLLERIEEIKREYEAVAKPYMDALVRSRSCKLTRHYVVIDTAPGELPQ